MAFVSWGWHLARMHQIKNSETDHRTCKTRAPLTSSVALLVYITYMFRLPARPNDLLHWAHYPWKRPFLSLSLSQGAEKHLISIVSLLLSHFSDSRVQGELQVSSGKERRLYLLSFAKRYIATHTVRGFGVLEPFLEIGTYALYAPITPTHLCIVIGCQRCPLLVQHTWVHPRLFISEKSNSVPFLQTEL